jgi:hypothetical protein
MTKEHEAWAMRAKAAGYPLCRDCQEPISLALQKAGGTRCGLCERAVRDLNDPYLQWVKAGEREAHAYPVKGRHVNRGWRRPSDAPPDHRGAYQYEKERRSWQQ